MHSLANVLYYGLKHSNRAVTYSCKTVMVLIWVVTFFLEKIAL